MKADIIYQLINEIGLSINANNQIFDQDFRTPLFFEGKALKYSFTERINLNRNTDYLFNPLTNKKLMNHLFSYYKDKMNNVYGKDYNIDYLVQDPTNPARKAINLKSENKIYKTKYYYNDSLRYIDIILTLGGYNVDLTEFDNEFINNKRVM